MVQHRSHSSEWHSPTFQLRSWWEFRPRSPPVHSTAVGSTVSWHSCWRVAVGHVGRRWVARQWSFATWCPCSWIEHPDRGIRRESSSRLIGPVLGFVWFCCEKFVSLDEQKNLNKKPAKRKYRSIPRHWIKRHAWVWWVWMIIQKTPVFAWCKQKIVDLVVTTVSGLDRWHLKL